jgi:hypothetical protein
MEEHDYQQSLNAKLQCHRSSIGNRILHSRGSVVTEGKETSREYSSSKEHNGPTNADFAKR